jgi:DNA-binding response OmpR family regulator
MTKIIILEDDATIRHLYRTMFQKAGFDVRAYADAVHLVEKAKDFRPDVVLTDLLMPKIDGFEAIRLLRAEGSMKNLPIVVISNLGDYVSQQKSAYLGATDFIVKSNFTPAALTARIRDVVAGKTPKIVVDQKIIQFLQAEESAHAQHETMTPEERQYT